MTEYVMVIVHRADGGPTPQAGQYVKSFTPGGPGNRGYLVTTPDQAEAMRFATPLALHTFWRQAHGVRPDGKPNRPLTAYTIEACPAGDVPLTDNPQQPPPPKERH
jgi:hypothetical protein